MDRASNVVSEREAAAWHDRLHRDKVSDETRRAFADWLEQSPRHRVLYDAIDEVWSKLRGAAEDPQILALRHETALRLTRRTSETARPLRWAAAAVLVTVLSVAAIATLRSPDDHSLIASFRNTFHLGSAGHYETATGERLTFTLNDGSQVTLDTQSELKVSFSTAERSVHLTRGQAFFEVAKDPQRPFVVEVRSRRFVAVGTAFDVRVDGDQVRVTMVEGTVRVEGRGQEVAASNAPGFPTQLPSSGTTGRAANRDMARSESPAVTTITAGEQLITDAQREDHVRAADPERSTSWRRGQLVFDNTRLADAIAEVNRYSEAKIELADPDLGNLRLSGAFATGRPTVFVEAVTTYFPVRVTRSDDREVVLGSVK
jgi:transmembrane sensor